MSPSNQPAGPAAGFPPRLAAALLPKHSTVLIAEDDPISARILQATLAKFGYDPVVASNGAEAWEAFDREPVRLIVSDWMMPGLDGLAFCEKVRARGHTAYTYFILSRRVRPALRTTNWPARPEWTISSPSRSIVRSFASACR